MPDQEEFMQESIDAIEEFFRAFESNASSHDTAAQVSHFADVFMAANPQGAQVVRAGDFALALPRKKQLFDKLGCRTTASSRCGRPGSTRATRWPQRDGE